MGIVYCQICESHVATREAHDIKVCDTCYDVLCKIDACPYCAKVVAITNSITLKGHKYHHPCYKEVTKYNVN